MTLEYLTGVLILLLALGYWLFFKKFFSELGKQTAEIANLAKRTTIVEDIKATLARRTIAYQIQNAEFARLQFERLDRLYANLYDLQKFSQSIFGFGDKAEFLKNREEFLRKYRLTEDSYFLSVLYLDDETAQTTLDLLNECHRTFGAFIDFYYSDPSRDLYRNLPPSDAMIQRNSKAVEVFTESLDKFPKLLRQIRTQVHKTLKDDNGG